MKVKIQFRMDNAKKKVKTQNSKRPRKLESLLIGPLTSNTDKENFDFKYPAETKLTGEPGEAVEMVYNSKPYMKNANPYERMVNSAMLTKDSKEMTFKARSFYNKVKELTMSGKDVKLDQNNPIFLHIANPAEYRYYKVD